MLNRDLAESKRFRPRLRRLEDRVTPAGFFAAGADAGGAPEVRVFDAVTGELRANFPAYSATFTGGVRVAIGDVTGDGVDDLVTAPGPGGGPHVKVFSGRDLSLVASFFAFEPSFAGGVSVAVGDINRDGLPDIITGAGAGGAPRVCSFTAVAGVIAPVAGPLGDFLAYGANFRGGVTVAAGNLDGRRGDEIITGAGAGGTPHVKAFAADGSTVASFLAYAPGFSGGVNVAAGDVNADGHADIITGAGAGGAHVKVFDRGTGTPLASFFAFDTPTSGGVRVAGADVNADGHADIVTGAGPGGGPHQRLFDGRTFQATTSLFAFDPRSRGGLFVAGVAADTRGDPNFFQLTPEVPVLSRLARFVPGPVPAVSNWVAVNPADPTLAGKNVYVVAHGWAPGFEDMVDAYVSNNLPNPPLKWWQTLNTFLPDSPGTPASPEMFYARDGDDVQISPAGVANALALADPNAVILAYSWIDDSATSSTFGLPTDSYLSEARTALNGTRLANALQQALPATFAAGGGKLHLIGHSHGSKVATVAANVLAQAASPNLAVAHLTLLDSPEDDSFLVRQGDSANNLWYFLGALGIGRTAGTTFVDNYISEFDNPLGVIQGVNPFNTATTTTALQQLVDVTLDPSLLFSTLKDPINGTGDSHAYAFNWYGGGSLTWAQNPTPAVANVWSPLVNPATPATLAGNYDQSWAETSDPQFALTPGGAQPSFNTVTTTPTFTDLAFTATSTTPGATFAGGTVTLSEAGGSKPTFTGTFQPGSAISGISLNLQFTNVGAGDQLVISANTSFLGDYQMYYIMTGTVAGTTPRFGTLSLTSLAGDGATKLQIQLQTVAGSNARVTVSNLQQFAV